MFGRIHCALQWRSQPRNFWGAKMFDFGRITLHCLEKHLSKHKMTIFSKDPGGPWPLCPPGYAYGALCVTLLWLAYRTGVVEQCCQIV